MFLFPRVLGLLCTAAAVAAAADPTSTAPTEACTQTTFPVPNGDFESGQLAPWTSGGTNGTVSIISPGYDDQYAARFQLTGQYTNFYIYQRSTACATTKYQLDFAYRVIGNASSCNIYVQGFAEDDGTSGSIQLSLEDTDGWKTASVQFQLANAQEYEISASLGCYQSATVSNATLDLDSFTLTDLGSLIPPGCPKEVSLSNGDFESGSLEPWNLDQLSFGSVSPGSEAGVVAPGFNGSNYLFRIDFASHYYRNRAEFILTQNIFNVCLDSSYEFGLSYRWIGNTTALAARQATLDILIRDCYASDHYGFTGTPVQGWQNVTDTCTSRNSSTASGPQDSEFVILSDFGVVAGVIPPFSIEVDNAWVRLIE